MAIQAIAEPTFQRAMRVISTLSNANPAIVVTTFAHQYQDGMIARLIVPPGYGMYQANQLQGVITVIDDVTFSIDIDTSLFDKFIVIQNIDITDGSGDTSGNIYNQVVVVQPPMPGQTFTIGTQIFVIAVGGGDLITTNGTGTGTLDLSTGDYTFTGAPALQYIYWNPISFPQNMQFPQVVPVGEQAYTLINATVNALPYEGV